MKTYKVTITDKDTNKIENEFDSNCLLVASAAGSEVCNQILMEDGDLNETRISYLIAIILAARKLTNTIITDFPVVLHILNKMINNGADIDEIITPLTKPADNPSKMN